MNVSVQRLVARIVCVTVISAATAALARSAYAQSTANSTARAPALEEIVVTARRREESLLEVPVAVTAVTAEQLELRGAPDITDLQRSTPSLTLQVSRGTNSTLTAFIRGVGQQDPLWGFESGVGLYVDDVYLARPQGAVLDILDVARIEVLRGPQGTLYGRNTIGGAIKYVTQRLSASQTQLKLRAEVGTYSELNGVAVGSVPVGDSWRFGAAVGKYTHDGYGTNLFSGAEHGFAKNVITGRAVAEFEPTNSLFFRLSVDTLHDRSKPYHGHREVAGIGAAAAVLPNKYDTMAGLGDNNEVNTSGAALLGEWQITESITLKSISAYREGETNSVGIDFDNTPAPVLDVASAPNGGYDDDQFSQELQALFSGERWQGVVGLYYLNATASGGFDTILQNGLPVVGITQQVNGSVDTESYAVFGDLSVDLTARIKASLGLRWTQDDKTGEVFKANYAGLGSPLTGRNVAPLQTLTNYKRSRSFSDVSPRASVSFAPAPNTNTYLSFSRGFKSGGFDMRGDATAYPQTVEGYDPEYVDAYELGLKTRLLDGRVTLSSALFDQEYKDQQVTTTFAGPPPSFVVSVVDNVGRSRIRGVEVEGTAAVTTHFTAQASASYLSAEFLEYQSFDPITRRVVDVASQRRLQNTPKWIGFLGAVYRQPVGSWGEITYSGSASYRHGVTIFETPSPIDQGSYQLYDASVVWTNMNGQWRVGIFGRNLTDERYRTGGYLFPGAVFNNSIIGFYGPPRTGRVSATYRF